MGGEKRVVNACVMQRAGTVGHNDTRVPQLTVHRTIHRRLVVIDNLVLIDQEGNLHLQRLDHIRLSVV